ncbi:hypothetical protein J7E88_27115 [Streptomyces sp. ISL-10]|uniref:hypothetical protein n=1 Tax=Streptomyces sp. ISL-10 TaxID=2819172 RepID=UPI001BEB0CC2|nr:hypothetical protein [Streptomyces sp. ISL-10]MBT2368888.1 hypothetical protein [Streptomyces sp. ISL-10]
MQSVRTRFAAVVAAVLLCLTGVVLAVQSETTTASAQNPSGGIAHMFPGRVNLQPTGSGSWVNTPLRVFLPRPGTYILDADVRGRLAGDGQDRLLASIQARLWDATDGAVVPRSERLVTHMNIPPLSGVVAKQSTAPISERITVTEPTVIRLQVRRVNSIGETIRADIFSDGSGRTSLRYQRV